MNFALSFHAGLEDHDRVRQFRLLRVSLSEVEGIDLSEEISSDGSPGFDGADR